MTVTEAVRVSINPPQPLTVDLMAVSRDAVTSRAVKRFLGDVNPKAVRQMKALLERVPVLMPRAASDPGKAAGGIGT